MNISTYVNEQEKLIDQVFDSILQLEARLAPISIQQQPVPVRELVTTITNSPVGHQLVLNNSKLEQLHDKLTDIITRIDV